MAAKKPEMEMRERFMEMPRKLYLAYLGAFGVVGDEALQLFDRFVERGERVEKQMRKLVNEVQAEQPKLAARVEKAGKRAIKRAESVA